MPSSVLVFGPLSHYIEPIIMVLISLILATYRPIMSFLSPHSSSIRVWAKVSSATRTVLDWANVSCRPLMTISGSFHSAIVNLVWHRQQLSGNVCWRHFPIWLPVYLIRLFVYCTKNRDRLASSYSEVFRRRFEWPRKIVPPPRRTQVIPPSVVLLAR